MLLLIAGCRSKPDHNWLLYARNDRLWSAEKDQGKLLGYFYTDGMACVVVLLFLMLFILYKNSLLFSPQFQNLCTS